MAGSDWSSIRHAFWRVRSFILVRIGVLGFSIRFFSVIKYESVIHEFDPYFNYRFLTKKEIYDFWNWFDDRTWLVNSLNIPLSVETVCAFSAPVFSAFASWATYLLTKEVKGAGAGLNAAALLAMTLNTGSLFYTTLNVISYFYMVFVILRVIALVHYIKGIFSLRMFKVAVTLVLSVGLLWEGQGMGSIMCSKFRVPIDGINCFFVMVMKLVVEILTPTIQQSDFVPYVPLLYCLLLLGQYNNAVGRIYFMF